MRPRVPRARPGRVAPGRGRAVRLSRDAPSRPRRSVVGVQRVGAGRARGSHLGDRARRTHGCRERRLDRRAAAGAEHAERRAAQTPREDRREPVVRRGGSPGPAGWPRDRRGHRRLAAGRCRGRRRDPRHDPKLDHGGAGPVAGERSTHVAGGLGDRSLLR